MKSVGNNCSQSISFRMQVTVYYIVNDTHKVMMALILVVLVLVWLALKSVPDILLWIFLYNHNDT